MSPIDQLPNDVEVLKRMVLERDAYLKYAQLQIESLKAMLARLRDQRAGRSSEALDAQIEQLELALEELESFKAAKPADFVFRTTPQPFITSKSRSAVIVRRKGTSSVRSGRDHCWTPHINLMSRRRGHCKKNRARVRHPIAA